MNFLARWWRNQQLYRQLASIKEAVDARITYEDSGADEWAYIRKDATGRGDCQVFAQTYMIDCRYAGLQAERFVLWVTQGSQLVKHAHCVVNAYDPDTTWILDNRERYPVRV